MVSAPSMSSGEGDASVRFLGELNEATRDLSDPERLLAVVAERLGRHLCASRCAYAEVEPDEDSFTIRHDYTHECRTTTGQYQLSAFGGRAAGDQRAGRRLVICDVDVELSAEDGRDTFNSIDVKAIVCCPLIKAGRLVAMMAVHQTAPRSWSPDEVALVEAVVERCWAYLEQARAVRNLAQSEARFRQLADAMPQIVWTARPDGVLDYYNRRWFEYIQVPEADIAQASWDRYLHPDDLPLVRETWARSLASGDEYVSEFRVRRADHRYRWFLVRALPIRDEQQRITRWFGTCTDIDDKKRSDEALRISRQQLEMVVKRANVGVWYCPLPFDELVWDDKVKEHFHLPPEATVDIDLFYERVHPDDRERTRQAIEHSIAAHQTYEIDYRTVSADGQRIKWVHASGGGYYDGQGKPVRFDGITIDVTERARAEISLRESEQRFRTMSDSAPVMIWVTRTNGDTEYQNRRWYEFTGQTSDEALGSGWMQALHPDDSARVVDAYQSARLARASFEIEYRLRRRDGQYRWCVDTAAPRLSAHGEFLGHIGSVIDITDRKVAEQERALLLESERAARIVAERASRMKDEFLATLSHELRTPLNAVLGWSQILKTVGASPQDLEKGLAVIERNARAQTRIIEDLLDMSRIVSGKMRLELQSVSVVAWVRSALEAIQPAADAKGIKLSTQLDVAAELAVRGDPSRLHQVVWNLLSNAVKFTPRGGSVEIRVDNPTDSQLAMYVIDTGEGIP
ncbi:MAG: PAS domain-containing protein, partial [Polyangiaceae bacterium]